MGYVWVLNLGLRREGRSLGKGLVILEQLRDRGVKLDVQGKSTRLR